MCVNSLNGDNTHDKDVNPDLADSDVTINIRETWLNQRKINMTVLSFIIELGLVFS